jgi:hypothetical protein
MPNFLGYYTRTKSTNFFFLANLVPFLSSSVPYQVFSWLRYVISEISQNFRIWYSTFVHGESGPRPHIPLPANTCIECKFRNIWHLICIGIFVPVVLNLIYCLLFMNAYLYFLLAVFAFSRIPMK